MAHGAALLTAALRAEEAGGDKLRRSPASLRRLALANVAKFARLSQTHPVMAVLKAANMLREVGASARRVRAAAAFENDRVGNSPRAYQKYIPQHWGNNCETPHLFI